MPPAAEVQSLNHWTAREVPRDTNFYKTSLVVPQDTELYVTCASSNIQQLGPRKRAHLPEQQILPNTVDTKTHHIIHHIILPGHTFKHLIDLREIQHDWTIHKINLEKS